MMQPGMQIVQVDQPVVTQQVPVIYRQDSKVQMAQSQQETVMQIQPQQTFDSYGRPISNYTFNGQ
jgi:hypothetical protein